MWALRLADPAQQEPAVNTHDALETMAAEVGVVEAVILWEFEPRQPLQPDFGQPCCEPSNIQLNFCIPASSPTLHTWMRSPGWAAERCGWGLPTSSMKNLCQLPLKFQVEQEVTKHLKSKFQSQPKNQKTMTLQQHNLARVVVAKFRRKVNCLCPCVSIFHWTLPRWYQVQY